MAVYFIQQGKDGPVKIGFTKKEPLKRLYSLQTANPKPLRLLLSLTGDFELERLIHKKLAHLRLRGEWFEFCPEMVTFIEVCSKKQAEIERHLQGAVLSFVNGYGEEDSYG